LRVAKQQPHVGATNSAESAAAVREPPDWQERNKARSALIANGVPPGQTAVGEAAKPPRKPRVAHAKVSAAAKGVIPTTLGGELPPVSVLSRREFGLRALRRRRSRVRPIADGRGSGLAGAAALSVRPFLSRSIRPRFDRYNLWRGCHLGVGGVNSQVSGVKNQIRRCHFLELTVLDALLN
jgi:hypothetical protein